MQIRPLIIDADVAAMILKVTEYAEAHKLDIRDILRLLAHPEEAPGRDNNRRCVIPVGYRCVYTIEQHEPGWFRHLSLSVDEPGMWPGIEAAGFIIKIFGFRGTAMECANYVESEHRAVNFLEPYEPENRN